MKAAAAIAANRPSPTSQLTLAPVEEAAGEDDAQQVEPGDQHEEVRAPVVDRAHEGAEGHLRLEPLDRRVGLPRHRRVGEHQERAGRREQREQDERHPAETEGVREADRRGGDAHRTEVEDESADHRPRALPVAFVRGRRGACRHRTDDSARRPLASAGHCRRRQSRRAVTKIGARGC